MNASVGPPPPPGRLHRSGEEGGPPTYSQGGAQNILVLFSILLGDLRSNWGVDASELRPNKIQTKHIYMFEPPPNSTVGKGDEREQRRHLIPRKR